MLPPIMQEPRDAGIGRVIQAHRLDGLVESLRHDARFGDGHEVVGVDLEDRVHALEGKREASGEGQRSARQARASALRRHRDAVFVAEREETRDLVRRPGLRGRRGIEDEVLRPVVRVRLQVVHRHEEVRRSHDRGESRELGGGEFPSFHD